jgi:hypothetical protein
MTIGQKKHSTYINPMRLTSFNDMLIQNPMVEDDEKQNMNVGN